MSKNFIRFLFTLLITIILVVIFLTYYGIETNRFDNLIIKKTNAVNKNVKLDFNKTRIYLNPKELNLVVKLKNPKIVIKKNKIDLSKLNLFLSLKSLYSSDSLLNKVVIAFKENDIQDITKITNIFLPKIINNQLNKIFAKGILEGEFYIPFQTNGDLAKDYGFQGKILNASINLMNGFVINNLTAEVNYRDSDKNGGLNFFIKEGSLLDIKLNDSTINLKRKDKKIKAQSIINTKGKINFLTINKLTNLIKSDISNFKDINGNIDIQTNIDFDLSNKFKLENLLYSSEGNLTNFVIKTNESNHIKKYLPKYDSKLIFKDTKIKFFKFQSKQTLDLNGLVKINEEFDEFQIKQVYLYNKKTFNVDGKFSLNSSKINIPNINYIKDIGENADLNFNLNFILNKYFNIENIQFLSDKTKISLSNVKLNKIFQINDISELEVKTFLKDIKNNDFVIKKSKDVNFFGDVFDAEPILKTLFNENNKNIFSKSFSSKLKVNLKKVLTGTEDSISDFAMVASINEGTYDKLILKGNFSKNEIIEMSIYKINENEKTLHIVSDRAKPFIKNFKFIKGFEGGKIQYESIIGKEISNSNLVITDFKVSEVPSLAKLLTLASFRGIADTLSGEGIRFESFEMKSNSKGNLLNIEEALAVGPAISILIDGYIDKGNIVSLRGTLVPATKLNSIIASIPVVGGILVGKKTGEGVVGVSFKMKGPPKNIKTTVNPIKTLTPRFIVRALEHIKKRGKDKKNSKAK